MADNLDEERHRSPSIITVDRAVAVLTERMASLKENFESVEKKLDTALALFATKEDLKVVSERVSKLEGQIGWAVKAVIGIVIAAVVGGVIVAGKH